MEIEPKHNHMTLFVCLACQRNCPECSQRGLMAWKPDYQMPLDEIENFINCTPKSEHKKFTSVIVSGGEPLLWKNLEAGTKMLKDSGIARAVNVFSNGMNVERVTTELLDNISMLRVSVYADNREAVNTLVERFGRRKIISVPRTKHTPIPQRFLDGVLPARCGCEGFALCNGIVYACPMVPAIKREHGIDFGPFPETYTDLHPDWMDDFERFQRENHQFCRACIGNLKVREAINGI